MSRQNRLEIRSGKITWETHQAGDGERVLFAFHGFNRGFDDLLHLSNQLSGCYKVISVSLFFHGSSYDRTRDSGAFDREELQSALSALVSAFTSGKYSVMAHSFGGRLALNMVELGPPGLEELFLLSPDALRYHPGYRFLTGTRIGRFLMGNFNKNPSRIIAMVGFFSKIGVYHPKTANYFINQISHPKVRGLVFDSWMVHRLTIPNLKNVAAAINRLRIRTVLIFGKNDKLIPIRQGERFLRRISRNGSLQIIDCGHRLYEKTEELGIIIKTK